MQKIKCFSITLSVFVLFFAVAGPAHAQSDTIRLRGNVYAQLVLKIPGYSISDLSKSVVDPEARMEESSIHIRAVRDFKKRYKHAVNEIWLPSTNGFAVRFNENAISTTVRYTNAGNWIHTIKRYHEPDLAREIRALIKPVYYDYSIVVIYELIERHSVGPVYFVHLKENRNYKIVRLSDGEMHVVQSFRLQSN